MPQYINRNGGIDQQPGGPLSVSQLFEERSEAAQEIISRKPAFLERWSLIIFLVVLVMLLLGARFVSYPDIVSGRVVLLGEKSPKEIVARSNGRLVRVLVSNNKVVKAGELLGWLDSDATIDEVLALSEKVKQGISLAAAGKLEGLELVFDKKYYQLGTVQPSYQVFATRLDQYKAGLRHTAHPASAITQSLEESLYTLRSAVEGWIRQYAIQAPADGQLAYGSSFQQDRYLTQGAVLGYILPHNDSYYAELKIQQRDLGKVDTGMLVQLRMDAYPYHEAGMLQGTLVELSRVSIDSAYTASVRLTNGLVTNQHKVIPFMIGLKGEAIVVAKERSLLNRFYYKLFP